MKQAPRPSTAGNADGPTSAEEDDIPPRARQYLEAIQVALEVGEKLPAWMTIIEAIEAARAALERLHPGPVGDAYPAKYLIEHLASANALAQRGAAPMYALIAHRAGKARDNGARRRAW
ncbi:MAG TPA: hypothetical protein VHE35_13870, partial [Kofleriaceae bacterium]|nr:hypothetical protein [Kofleriaceae bacterium]